MTRCPVHPRGRDMKRQKSFFPKLLSQFRHSLKEFRAFITPKLLLYVSVASLTLAWLLMFSFRTHMIILLLAVGAGCLSGAVILYIRTRGVLSLFPEASREIIARGSLLDLNRYFWTNGRGAALLKVLCLPPSSANSQLLRTLPRSWKRTVQHAGIADLLSPSLQIWLHPRPASSLFDVALSPPTLAAPKGREGRPPFLRTFASGQSGNEASKGRSIADVIVADRSGANSHRESAGLSLLGNPKGFILRKVLGVLLPKAFRGPRSAFALASAACVLFLQLVLSARSRALFIAGIRGASDTTLWAAATAAAVALTQTSTYEPSPLSPETRVRFHDRPFEILWRELARFRVLFLCLAALAGWALRLSAPWRPGASFQIAGKNP
jgi:hypothetical protein